VSVLQFAENLSDRAAADAVRTRIDWKYGLGLELDDPGFDHSVLSEFRALLAEGSRADQLLQLLLDRLVAAGLLKGRGRQRTDATHVLAAVRRLSRLELAGESVRAALEEIAEADPAGWTVPTPLSGATKSKGSRRPWDRQGLGQAVFYSATPVLASELVRTPLHLLPRTWHLWPRADSPRPIAHSGHENTD